MLLSGKEIARRVRAHELTIEPFNPEHVNPNSYDLTLHEELLEFSDIVLDMRKPAKTSRIVIPPEGLVIYPGKLYLGRTVEYTETPKLAPFLEGRSSVGRLGIQVHITAGFGDVGFAGFWTLEITCVMPVRIYANVRVCQIGYSTVLGDAVPYAVHGKYHGSRDILASKMYLDFRKDLHHAENTQSPEQVGADRRDKPDNLGDLRS